MKRILVIFLIIFVSSLAGIVVNVDLPILYSKDSNFILRIDEGFDDTESARMLYREAGNQVYNEVEMGKGTISNPIYQAILPKDIVFLTTIEFYFEIILNDGAIITYPELNPQLNPNRISVKKDETISEGFVLLSPDSSFPDESDKMVIAISYFTLQDEINTSSIQFIYNGKDYTEKAKISNSMAILEIQNPKKAKNSFQLIAKTNSGNDISSEIWKVTKAIKKMKLPLNFKGDIAICGSLDSGSEIDNSKDANLRMNVGIGKNWFKLKTKVLLKSLEDSNKQSVNRFRFDIDVPHFNLIFGDYSPNIGAFAFNSVNVRGVFSELYFPKFRMLAHYGNSKRAVPGDLIAIPDSTGVEYSYSNNDVEFERRTMALRTEFRYKNHFNFGFNLVKNKDIVESLDEAVYIAPDSTLLVRPKDNIVFSTDSRFSFKDQRIILGAEAAMSLYNSNILDGSITKDSLESIAGSEIPVDPADFEDIFVLSSSIEPFIPGLSNLSYKAYLRVFLFHNLINVSYSYIGQSFNNLGVGYLGKDIATLSVNDNLSLFNNRLLLNLAYNLSSNNLMDDKQFTTTNSTIFSQIYARPTESSFINFNYNTNVSENDLSDSDKYQVGSDLLGFGVGYDVKQISYAPTKFSVSYSNSISEDKANNSFELSKNILTFSTISKFRDFPLTSTVGFSLSMDDNIYAEVNSEYKYFSYFMTYKYKMFDEKLEPFANIRFSNSSGDVESNSQLVNFGSSYKLDRLTRFYAVCGYSNYSDNENNDSQINMNFRIKRSF